MAHVSKASSSGLTFWCYVKVIIGMRLEVWVRAEDRSKVA